MDILENVTSGFSNLRANKLRSSLTILAIVILASLYLVVSGWPETHWFVDADQPARHHDQFEDRERLADIMQRQLFLLVLRDRLIPVRLHRVCRPALRQRPQGRRVAKRRRQRR